MQLPARHQDCLCVITRMYVFQFILMLLKHGQMMQKVDLKPAKCGYIESLGARKHETKHIKRRQCEIFGHMYKHNCLDLEKLAISGYVTGEQTPGCKDLPT